MKRRDANLKLFVRVSTARLGFHYVGSIWGKRAEGRATVGYYGPNPGSTVSLASKPGTTSHFGNSLQSAD